MELLMIQKERIFLYDNMHKTTLYNYLLDNGLELHAEEKNTFPGGRNKFCQNYQAYLEREKPVYPGVAGVSYVIKGDVILTNEDVFRTMGISVFFEGRAADGSQRVFIPACTFSGGCFTAKNCDVFCFPEILRKLTVPLAKIPSMNGTYQILPSREEAPAEKENISEESEKTQSELLQDYLSMNELPEEEAFTLPDGSEIVPEDYEPVSRTEQDGQASGTEDFGDIAIDETGEGCGKNICQQRHVITIHLLQNIDQKLKLIWLTIVVVLLCYSAVVVKLIVPPPPSQEEVPVEKENISEEEEAFTLPDGSEIIPEDYEPVSRTEQDGQASGTEDFGDIAIDETGKGCRKILQNTDRNLNPAFYAAEITVVVVCFIATLVKLLLGVL